MAKVTLNTIKNWFRKGLKPTQTQFWSTFDSFWHKDEKIPIINIDRIETILSEKADAELVNNHLNDPNAHKELFDQKVDKVDGKVLSSNDFTDELKKILEKLTIPNISFEETFLNKQYFEDDVYGILLPPSNSNISSEDLIRYLFKHNLNIKKYLKIEVYRDGLPDTIDGELARQDLSVVVKANSGSLTKTPIEVDARKFIFPQGTNLYLEYTKFNEGIGTDIVGTTIVLQ